MTVQDTSRVVVYQGSNSLQQVYSYSSLISRTAGIRGVGRAGEG